MSEVPMPINPRPLAILTRKELADRILEGITHPKEYVLGDPRCPGCKAEPALRELLLRCGDTERIARFDAEFVPGCDTEGL